jgi:signal transduction histidine kinase
MKTLNTGTPVPENEAIRLSRLYEYEILNTARETEFDRVAELAADLMNCPGAFINFVDAQSVFSKANTLDYPADGIPRDKSLCAITILSDDPLIVADTHDYEELRQSPWTHGEKGIRFYAAVPLTTNDGFRLGTLCVIDYTPRNPTPQQLRMLASLAKIVMDKLEIRIIHRKAFSIQTDYVNRTMHDLKNYVANLMVAAEILGKQNAAETLPTVSGIVTRNTKRIAQRLDDVLNLSKIQHEAYQLNIERCELSSLLDNVIENYRLAASGKQQILVKEYTKELFVDGDCGTLTEVFDNLVSNAIKYSFPGSSIRIVSERRDHELIIGFHDEGQGLSDGDKEKLFVRYAKLSAIPTGKEITNGLGLAISKILVELNKGKLWAESEGIGKGASFFVSLPAV